MPLVAQVATVRRKEVKLYRFLSDDLSGYKPSTFASSQREKLDGNQMNIIEAVGVTSSLVDRLALEMTQILCQTS